MKSFIRTHWNDILLAFFVMASAARGIGQIDPLAGQTAVQTANVTRWTSMTPGEDAKQLMGKPEPLWEPFPR